jgi:hypothetical protein
MKRSWVASGSYYGDGAVRHRQQGGDRYGGDRKLISIPEGRLGELGLADPDQHVATDADGLHHLRDAHGGLGDGVCGEVVLDLLSALESAEDSDAVHDHGIHQSGHRLGELGFDQIKILQRGRKEMRRGAGQRKGG